MEAPPYRLTVNGSGNEWGWSCYRLVETGGSKSKRKADRASVMAMFADCQDFDLETFKLVLQLAFDRIEVKKAGALLKRLGFKDAAALHTYCGMKES